jgi:hypothetical protein
VDEDGFDAGIDTVRDREREVERDVLTVDVVPLMLLSIDALPTAAGPVAPIPLEIKELQGNVICRSAG